MSNSAGILVVLGSVTPPGRMHRALNGALERFVGNGGSASLLDLGTVTIGFADGRPLEALRDDTRTAVEAVTSASGVILASPVYRGSLTGALKNFLDVLPIEGLRQKPVGLVAMGATAHHFLGTASHLRDVCSWFGALVAPTDVYLTSADFADGVPQPGPAADLDALFTTVQRLAGFVQASGELGPTPLAAKAR
jgi:FMN reductase